MTHKKLLIFDAVLFQILWLVCIFGGTVFAMIGTLASIILHTYWCHYGHHIHSPKRWYCFLGIAIITGWIHDGLYVQLGLFEFSNYHFIPPWLLCLWVCYWLTWYWSLDWMSRWPIRSSVLAGIAGAYSYGIGYALDKVSWPYGVELTAFILFISWTSLTYMILQIKCYLSKTHTTNVQEPVI